MDFWSGSRFRILWIILTYNGDMENYFSRKLRGGLVSYFVLMSLGGRVRSALACGSKGPGFEPRRGREKRCKNLAFHMLCIRFGCLKTFLILIWPLDVERRKATIRFILFCFELPANKLPVSYRILGPIFFISLILLVPM